MRREAMVLGHPRFSFPIQARIHIQSIGSGAKFAMQAESLRSWDLTLAHNPEQKPGYNPLSLLEIWIDDEVLGRRVYGFAKFMQALDGGRMMVRIVEIDLQNREYLQELMHRASTFTEQDAV